MGEEDRWLAVRGVTAFDAGEKPGENREEEGAGDECVLLPSIACEYVFVPNWRRPSEDMTWRVSEASERSERKGGGG
jgi:hypothetical protein